MQNLLVWAMARPLGPVRKTMTDGHGKSHLLVNYSSPVCVKWIGPLENSLYKKEAPQ